MLCDGGVLLTMRVPAAISLWCWWRFCVWGRQIWQAPSDDTWGWYVWSCIPLLEDHYQIHETRKTCITTLYIKHRKLDMTALRASASCTPEAFPRQPTLSNRNVDLDLGPPPQISGDIQCWFHGYAAWLHYTCGNGGRRSYAILIFLLFLTYQYSCTKFFPSRPMGRTEEEKYPRVRHYLLWHKSRCGYLRWLACLCFLRCANREKWKPGVDVN
jgi:hypothetical protein